jgi:hypothetical protein
MRSSTVTLGTLNGQITSTFGLGRQPQKSGRNCRTLTRVAIGHSGPKVPLAFSRSAARRNPGASTFCGAHDVRRRAAARRGEPDARAQTDNHERHERQALRVLRIARTSHVCRRNLRSALRANAGLAPSLAYTSPLERSRDVCMGARQRAFAEVLASFRPSRGDARTDESPSLRLNQCL